MDNLILKNESYRIVGACMEVHKVLGKGYAEVIYKDALEIEFKNLGIPYEREKRYEIIYKGIVLPHFYHADFVIFNQIILEAKAIECLASGHIKQTLNYLAAAKLRLGLLINFGEDSLVSKRIIL